MHSAWCWFPIGLLALVCCAATPGKTGNEVPPDRHPWHAAGRIVARGVASDPPIFEFVSCNNKHPIIANAVRVREEKNKRSIVCQFNDVGVGTRWEYGARATNAQGESCDPLRGGATYRVETPGPELWTVFRVDSHGWLEEVSSPCSVLP